LVVTECETYNPSGITYSETANSIYLTPIAELTTARVQETTNEIELNTAVESARNGMLLNLFKDEK